MNDRNYCLVSATVFSLVALLHFWRFVLHLPLQIGAWSVPPFASLVAAIVCAALAGWAFRSARRNASVQVVYT
jgi:uncharacterized membrane protein